MKILRFYVCTKPLNEPVFSVLAGGESLDLKVCFFFVPTPHADAWKRPPELINSKALFKSLTYFFEAEKKLAEILCKTDVDVFTHLSSKRL